MYSASHSCRYDYVANGVEYEVRPGMAGHERLQSQRGGEYKDAARRQSGWPGTESVQGIPRAPLEQCILAIPESAQDKWLSHQRVQDRWVLSCSVQCTYP